MVTVVTPLSHSEPRKYLDKSGTGVSQRDAKLLIVHFRDEELLRWDAEQRIFDVLAHAHKH